MSAANRTEATNFLSAHPHVKAVDLLVSDINGCQRGKRIRREALAKIYDDGVCMPGSLYAMDITGTTVEETGMGNDIGDADNICLPIPGRLALAPWQKPASGQVLMHMVEQDHRPFFADPRHVLETVVARFRDLQLTPVVAVELEFYLIDKKRDKNGRPQPPVSPVTGQREKSSQVYGINEIDDYEAFLEDVSRAAELQGLPADAAVSEYAPGQYEVNLHHRADAVAACDDAFLLKRLIKGVAKRHNMEATFMAKPYEKMVGSGLHIHMSLLDADGRNVFAGDSPLGSEQMHHAIGGLKATMREATALLAPNANSYRRYRVNNFVPMSPAWGTNNRTLALRIPAGPRAATRIEHRVAGADANPYTVMAAILAGAHHGMVNKIDPGPPTEGNAYLQHPPAIPRYWNEAISLFEKAGILPNYLGREFCRVYAAVQRHGCDQFNAKVTAQEYDWYLRNV